MHDYKGLITRWFQEVWNQNNPAAIDKLFHPEAMPTEFPCPTPTSPGPLPSIRSF
jgi:hypothetical protein